MAEISSRKKKFKLTEIFSDFDIEMSTQSQDLKKKKDIDAIFNSLNNIINTSPGERPMDNLSFGTDLNKWLFEPNDHESLQQIGEMLINSIEIQEPRVEIVNLEFEPLETAADENKIEGTLTFRVVNYDSSNLFTLNFYLNI